MMRLGIAAREKGRVWSTYVPAAYLNALVLEDIFVCLGKKIKILVDLFPEYGRFLRSGGKIVVKLKKALYGLKHNNYSLFFLNSTNVYLTTHKFVEFMIMNELSFPEKLSFCVDKSKRVEKTRLPFVIASIQI
jgi:hypothetical protein